ncbi:unnamed protein product [Clonostachys chloroleuca]|uniref:Uncharacterized protein n=1 Tax=Clonostachys chloroleuca TaxID=1926264 RepID=A0AA35LTR2_9HYPO|nr:unnamed protein product [Clonostachys chloroleuca]
MLNTETIPFRSRARMKDDKVAEDTTRFNRGLEGMEGLMVSWQRPRTLLVGGVEQASSLEDGYTLFTD